MLARLADLTDFARLLKGPIYHDFIHDRIGGVMGGARSPEDPIFWPSHGIFDRPFAD